MPERLPLNLTLGALVGGGVLFVSTGLAGEDCEHGYHGKHHQGEHHGYKGHEGRGHHGRHGRHARHGQWLMKRFDAGGDGKLTQAEIDQGRKAHFVRYDADQNGGLSVQEYEAMWLEMMRERIAYRFEQHDDDGNVTAGEFGRPLAGLVERMDRNEDGVLTVDEFGRHHKRWFEDKSEDKSGEAE